MTVAPPNFQHVVVEGLPYDRGVSHGQQAKEKILRGLAHYNQPGKLLPKYVTDTKMPQSFNREQRCVPANH